MTVSKANLACSKTNVREKRDLDFQSAFLKQLEILPTANPKPHIHACIRQNTEDFQVNEILSFEPSGEGEHLFLYIEKMGCNTDWVAKQLQLHFKLRSQDIGYAGKKDRHSVSRQWFSLHIPGKAISFEMIENDSFKVVQSIRHNKKLRRGSIKENQFKLVLSNISADININLINRVAQTGFPNYFGYQRFGHHAGNLVKADLLLNEKIRVKSRNKRGLYLSAARSFLFNLMLAQRIKDRSWSKAIDGDCLNLNGTQSYFSCDFVDANTEQRIKQGDLHVSGWLPGKQKSSTDGKAKEHESLALAPYSTWLNGLTKMNVDSGRRAMRVLPDNLIMSPSGKKQLTVAFNLPSGCFATSLLREFFIIEDLALKEGLND